MKKAFFQLLVLTGAALLAPATFLAQSPDTTVSKEKQYKNVVRYNLSGPLLFGFDKHVVFGFERLIGKQQSISVNFGKTAFPKLITFESDSFSLTRDAKNNGTNFSIDWRFYLAKENKFQPPHGLYIGPYYSFSGYKRTNEFNVKRVSGTTDILTSNVKFNIHTIGAEMGYQFVLWKRLTLDMVLIGPGISSYEITAKFDGNLNDADKEKLRDAVQQIITQKFPGMNYVMGDKELNADGFLDTWSWGYRYLIHIGFLF